MGPLGSLREKEDFVVIQESSMVLKLNEKMHTLKFFPNHRGIHLLLVCECMYTCMCMCKPMDANSLSTFADTRPLIESGDH